MKRLNFIKVFVVVFLFLFTGNVNVCNAGNKTSERTVKVLTIGNSFADNALTYLEQITESVEGCQIIYKKANIGGCYLEKHANLIKECENDPELHPYLKQYSLKDLLLLDKWDVVTIQQVSSKSFKPETFQPYADEIVAFVKKHAPQAKIYIHETWAYAPDCKRLDGFGITNKQMHQRLRKNYKALSKRYSAPILPSGDAFYKSLQKNNEVDLWTSKDRFHANMNGCYLAGCVWFGKLFGISPQKVTFKPEEMDGNTSEYLKKIASKVSK